MDDPNPQSQVPHDAVRAALASILASQGFATADRSSRLLSFLVDATLEGRAQYLKEYTLGADALGRGPGFDPRLDPIARVEASRLRKRLEQYFATDGANDDIIIALPKGSYQPRFAWRAQEEVVSTTTGRSWRQTARGFALLALIGAIGGAAYLMYAAPRSGTDQKARLLVRLEAALGASQTVASAVGSAVGLTPDGTRLVYQAQLGDGGTKLFALRLDALEPDALEPIELPGTFGASGGFFFSPDSRWVGFHADGRLKKALLDGTGSPITLAEASDFLGAAWSSAGTIIATLNRENVLWQIPEDGGTPTPLIDFGPAGPHPSWPQILPGGRGLIFSAQVGVGSASRIDVASIDGDSMRTLVPSGTHARYLPGGYLVYLDRGTLFAVELDVDSLDVQGTPTPVLTDVSFISEFGFGHYDVAPNGVLAYIRGAASGSSTIELLDDTGAARRLIEAPGRYTWPRFSLDGHRLTYSLLEGSDTDLWTLDLASGYRQRLTVGAGTQSMALWTPSGRFLIYYDGARNALVSRGIDEGSEPRLLVEGLNIPWSTTRDGRRLAYHGMGRDTGFDLWTVPIVEGIDGLAAGEPELFRSTGTYETYPAFSPDGSWMSHGANETGVWEVYVRAFPGSTQAVRISEAGGRISTWSSNGEELFYETNDRRLMVVPYRIDDGVFVPGQPRLWSTGQLADTGVLANFDLAPDGKSVVALVADEPPRDRVTVILNLTDELDRRLR